MTGDVIRKPVSAWNHEIEVDWGNLFAHVAKAGLKAAFFKTDDAWQEVIGGVEALGLRNKHTGATLAWLLINTALAKAVLALLIDARKRNSDLAEATYGDRAVAFDAAALMDIEIELTHDFLDRPERLPFLPEVRKYLEFWFAEIGVADAEAKTLAGRLTPTLIGALRKEWQNKQEWHGVEAWAYTPMDRPARRQACWEQITSEMQVLPDQPVFAEAFTLRDVHVPLRAYTVEQSDLQRRGRRRGEGDEQLEKPNAKLGWLREDLLSWIDSGGVGADWLRVISGGPGSGKSSSARMLAAELAGKHHLRVLYIQLHRFKIGGVMRNALADYCKEWLVNEPFDPLDALEPERRLILFLDGLDELTGSPEQAAAEVATTFAEELRRFLESANKEGRVDRVRAIVGGRELAVQSTSEARFRSAPVLHVCPYKVDPQLLHRFEWQSDKEALSEDQRPLWWAAFARATGRVDDGVPAAVRGNKELNALTEQPLLNYLVAGFAARHGSEIDASTSIATVYDALINDVYARELGQTEDKRSPTRLIAQIEGPGQFFRVLEEVALAVWHGGGRGATLRTVEAYLREADLLGLIRDFQERIETGIANLLLTFFFRQERNASGAAFFEFTHKSIQEYLTARRLCHAGEDLGGSGTRNRDRDRALEHWVEITGPMPVTKPIADFLVSEYRRYKDAEAVEDLRKRLSPHFSYQLLEGLPVERVTGPMGLRPDSGLPGPATFSAMRRWSDHAELALLALIGVLAPTEEEDPKAKSSPITLILPNAGALRVMMQRLQSREILDGLIIDRSVVSLNSLCFLRPVVRQCDNEATEGRSSQTALALRNMHLVGARLSGTVLDHSNLSRSNLRSADLTGTSLQGCNFSGAYLRRAKLRHANLKAADLTLASLRQADLTGADLTSASLAGTNLAGANLHGATLPEDDTLTKAKNLEFAQIDDDVRNRLKLPPQGDSIPRDLTDRGFDLFGLIETDSDALPRFHFIDSPFQESDVNRENDNMS